jgi:hypothetical protein
MNANDGGPAFPVQALASPGSEVAWGMSLRDWFAGQALVGMLACPDVSGDRESIAKSAYTYADTMLRARERGQEGGSR